MTSLTGRTAIVTGGSRGIGAAIVKELASYGANVVINYLERADRAAIIQSGLVSSHSSIELIQADVSKRDEVAGLVEQSMKRFKKIDILVNNAGITCDRTLKKMTFEEWNRVIQTNLTGVFNCTSLVVPQMIENKSGAIINVSSIIGLTGAIGQSNYAAAKAGVIGFTKSCSLELARHGITVNAICPGYVATDMLKAVPQDIAEGIRQRIPLGRFAQAEEIAKCVRFLITEGGYITGQSIHVNGGLFLA